MESSEGRSQVKRGLWKPEEDLILKEYVETYGEGNWADISRRSGLKRGGKSCRLRWKNYLRPNIKRGDMSKEEEDLIIRMHKLLGNRWSLIAGRLPGRTDNEVKNYWNTHLNKKRKAAVSDSGASVDKVRKKQHTIETQETNKRVDEESRITSTWADDIRGFGCYNGMESPMMLSDHTTCVLDDLEPSFALFDIFPLF